MLDAGAADAFAVSSSGSIQLDDLADELLSESDSADALSHDLSADALDPEGLIASGLEQLTTRRHRSAPIDLPEAPGLSSFADPPTMTGADGMPMDLDIDEPNSRKSLDDLDELDDLDDLDATLAALDEAPPRPAPARQLGDFDGDAQPLLTRADGPPPGMPPIPRPPPVDDEETDVTDFDDLDIEVEADYDSFEPQAPEEVDPDYLVKRRQRRKARAKVQDDLSADAPAEGEPTEGEPAEGDDSPRRGIFSRVFGRKKTE